MEELFKSWGIQYDPNNQTNKLASKRIEVCNLCENKIQNELSNNVCNLCGCGLKSKVFSSNKGECPAGKWNEVDNILLKKKMPQNIRYICCQPAITYYTWQVEVLINNFKKMGINPNYIDIVCAIDNNVIPPEWIKLMTHYNSVRFFFYNDTRKDKNYQPSVYFNLMKQHIVARPEIQNDVLFLHDSDIVFTKPVNFNSMMFGDAWYVSNTNSYINYNYIQEKGNHIYEKMCEIVGIDPKIPKLLNNNSGGAQYIVKNTTYEFWDKVENDSIELYKYFCEVEPQYVKKNEHDYPIQKWTAGMWSLLWNAWLAGHETIVDTRMDFGWVTNSYDDVNKYAILHNSGVTPAFKNLFLKSNYINKLPYFENIEVDTNRASYYYWKEICETANKSILIESTPEMEIKKDFEKYKITQLQLDPYGVCNAKCWYCPVKYKGNPVEGREVMSIELMEKIIKNIIDERDKPNGLVGKAFNGLYTAHYNEILLYPHFEEFLKLCRKYRLVTMVLSNGVPLTPERVDILKEYQDVLSGICLNTPAFDAETWSKRSGINIKQFDTLISNIKYAVEQLPNMVKNKAFSIQVNGVHDLSFGDKGGWLEKGEQFPHDIDLDVETGELVQQKKKAEELFPGVNIFTVPYLIDRAGLLDEVITNKPAIERNLMRNNEGKKVIGCGNGREVGGRPIGWLHVNAAGDAFLCCNDYDFDFKFGNFKTQELRDFWGNEEHIQKIKTSYETICRNCASAVFE
jgi:MoaA/NifB/PqqE/SkfB family radical SAM enzyme